VHVFLAHSTNDPAKQPELLDRAWTYLAEDSSAHIRALRYDGDEHAVSEVSLADLAD
jgi:hypothetical protein